MLAEIDSFVAGYVHQYLGGARLDRDALLRLREAEGQLATILTGLPHGQRSYVTRLIAMTQIIAGQDRAR